jgi:hypothetical protein
MIVAWMTASVSASVGCMDTQVLAIVASLPLLSKNDNSLSTYGEASAGLKDPDKPKKLASIFHAARSSSQKAHS